MKETKKTTRTESGTGANSEEKLATSVYENVFWEEKDETGCLVLKEKKLYFHCYSSESGKSMEEATATARIKLRYTSIIKHKISKASREHSILKIYYQSQQDTEKVRSFRFASRKELKTVRDDLHRRRHTELKGQHHHDIDPSKSSLKAPSPTRSPIHEEPSLTQEYQNNKATMIKPKITAGLAVPALFQLPNDEETPATTSKQKKTAGLAAPALAHRPHDKETPSMMNKPEKTAGLAVPALANLPSGEPPALALPALAHQPHDKGTPAPLAVTEPGYLSTGFSLDHSNAGHSRTSLEQVALVKELERRGESGKNTGQVRGQSNIKTSTFKAKRRHTTKERILRAAPDPLLAIQLIDSTPTKRHRKLFPRDKFCPQGHEGNAYAYEETNQKEDALEQMMPSIPTVTKRRQTFPRDKFSPPGQARRADALEEMKQHEDSIEETKQEEELDALQGLTGGMPGAYVDFSPPLFMPNEEVFTDEDSDEDAESNDESPQTALVEATLVTNKSLASRLQKIPLLHWILCALMLLLVGVVVPLVLLATSDSDGSQPPTAAPTPNTPAPSQLPNHSKRGSPTSVPLSSLSNQKPSLTPSISPSLPPSNQPSEIPSFRPSSKPSQRPSLTPSVSPSLQPSSQPSDGPSSKPSQIPSVHPSMEPSRSSSPSQVPSTLPTSSAAPSVVPSPPPTYAPVVLLPTDDTYTQISWPGSNTDNTSFGSETKLIVKYDGPALSRHRNSYLRFNLKEGGLVDPKHYDSSVELSIEVTIVPPHNKNGPICLDRVDALNSDWDESKLTWAKETTWIWNGPTGDFWQECKIISNTGTTKFNVPIEELTNKTNGKFRNQVTFKLRGKSPSAERYWEFQSKESIDGSGASRGPRLKFTGVMRLP